EGWVRVGDGAGLHQIAVGKNADGRLEVFAVDTNGVPWHTTQPTPSSELGHVSKVGGAVGLGEIMVISGINGGLDVFATDTAAWFLWTVFQNCAHRNFEGWVSVGNRTGFRHVTAGSNADGRLEVFAVDTNGVPWHTTQPTP